jgi:hypothetical protein
VEGVIDNSFQAPKESAVPPGQLDVVQVVSEGLAAVWRNLLPLAGGAVLGSLAYFVSFCTCVGWIPAIPLLFYGGMRMLLEAQQGKTRLATLWSGIEDPVPVFFSIVGLMLVYGVMLVPTIGLSVGMTLAKVDPVIAAAVNLPVSVLYSLVLVRFQMTPFLLIDRKDGVLDSFQRSWALTGPVWLKLIALQLLGFLLMSPVQVMGVGMQMLQQGQPAVMEPEEALAQLYPMMGLYTGVIVVSLVAGTLVWSMFAAAYRQLIGIQSFQAERA